MQRDIKTRAYVLRRTNYGEADRILNLITPEGKLSAIARGVRKSKSRLAGGVELFTLSEINVHQGKSDLGVVTGAKMLRYYGGIVKDLARMELAAEILKKVSRAAEGGESADYFKLVEQGLAGLDEGVATGAVESWFSLNLMRVVGEEMNLYRDASGAKLEPDKRYFYDVLEAAFREDERGEFGAGEIKLMRLMCTADLPVVVRVKNMEVMLPRVLGLVRLVGGNRVK